MPTLKAKKITGYTCVGYPQDHKVYPIGGKGGNCFGVAVEESKDEYWIINMGMESLKALIKRGIASWPIQIKVLANVRNRKLALISDPRIPDEWYSEHYCFTCTPKQYFRQKEHDRYNELYEEVKDEDGNVKFLRGRSRKI